MLRLRNNSAPERRTAFSLAELVISIGVLILMMALAGQVFTITIKSTGQATALTEVTQLLRVFEETLREDLRNVQPGQSMMLIQGNPVNAYWTQLGKEADDDADPANGYGHPRDLEREKLKADGTPDLDANRNEKLVEPRADILMFFTARKATSVVDPSITSGVQQVVYGHAELGEYQPDTASPPVYQMTTTPFPNLAAPFSLPAQRWHLARRRILLLPTSVPTTAQAALSWDDLIVANANGVGLERKELAEGQKDVVSEFRYDDFVLKPYLNSGVGIGGNWYLPPIFGDVSQLVPQFNPWSRCKLDPTPPMMMASRMGAYFLPNCASFKVEWALDPRSTFVNGRLDGTSEVFWIDPGDLGDPNRPTFKEFDPLYSIQKRIDELKNKSDALSINLRAQLESLLCEQVVHADGDKYSLADRFRGITCSVQGNLQSDPNYEWDQLEPNGTRPNMVAFTATRPHVTTDELVPDDIWPSALRITVDLYDREFRLERPIRHVMVIPIGG